MTARERDEARKLLEQLEAHIARLKEKNLDNLKPSEVEKVKKYLDKLTTVRDRIYRRLAKCSS